MSQRIGFLSFSQKKRLKELSFHPKYDTKNWTFFFSIWLKDFFQYDSKNWILLYNMTQRLGFFHQKKNSKNLTSYDSQTWTFFSKYFSKKMTRRIDPFFSLWLSKWNFFLKYEYESQSCFFFSIRITELIFFFFEYDFFFQNWIIFFEYDSKNSNSPIRLRGFNYFLRYDSKNWTFLVFQCDSMNSLRKTGKKFNALRQVRKKLNSSSQIIKGSVLWVQIQKKKFNSSSHVKKSSILKKKINFLSFQPKFQLSHIQKNGIDSLSRIQKKVSSILLSHTQKEVQFFESYFWKKSILWVIFKKKKKISSLSHVKKSSYEREVIFFETFWEKRFQLSLF